MSNKSKESSQLINSVNSDRKNEFVQKSESIKQLSKQVAKGGGIAFCGGIIGKILGFTLNILLSRVLGPGGFGIYALGASVTGIAKSVGSLGLPKGVVRFCAIYRGEKNKAGVKGTILTALGIVTISSVVASILIFVFAKVISETIFNETDLTLVLKIFALSIPFYAFMSILNSVALAFRRVDYQQKVENLFRPFINILLAGVAFLLGLRLLGAVFGFFATGILSMSLGFYFLRKIFPEILSVIRPIYKTKQLLLFSLPVFLSGFTYLLINYTDRLMLGYFRKASDVGIYTAAGNMAMMLTMILTALIPITSPIIADLHNKCNFEALSYIFRTVTRWAFTLTLPIFFIFFFASRGIMLVFGPEFVNGALVLMILSVSQLVNVGTGPVGMLFEMTGKQNIILCTGIILILSNVTLNLWLIPWLGATGAALATAISITSIFIVLLFLAYRIHKIRIYDKYFVRPIVAGSIAIILTVIIGMKANYNLFSGFSIVGVIFVIIFYITALVILGLSKDDRFIIMVIKDKIFGSKKSFL